MAAFSMVVLVVESIGMAIYTVGTIYLLCTGEYKKYEVNVVDERPAKVCEQQQATKDDKKPLVEPMDAVEYW